MPLIKNESSTRDRILAEIDAEIATLQKARILVAGDHVRNVSPEGRQRISQAVSRRWQQYRKAKKTTELKRS
jgi:hypothetical protein